jgi:AMMECR1 domain-containing protein
VGIARQALRQYFLDGGEIRAPELSPSLRRFDRRVVFLTIHVDGETRGCHSAARSSLGTNVVRATIRTVQDDRYVLKGVRGPDGKPVTIRPEEIDRARLELNIVGPYERLPYSDADSLRGEIEPGVHGVRLAKGQSGAFYLPYVQIEFEYDILPYLRTLASKSRLKPDEWKTSTLWRFPAENFVEAFPGGPALPLFRWNVLVPRIDAGTLDAATRRATAFIKGLRQGTALRLGYHPKRKKHLDEAPRWLVVRAVQALRAAGDTATASDVEKGVSPAPLPDLARAGVFPSLEVAEAVAGRVRDGAFPPELCLPGTPWEREHEAPLATAEGLAALARGARKGELLATSRQILERAAAEYGDRSQALADLIAAAAALHQAGAPGDWLARARTWGERLLAFQWSSAPWPDHRGALHLDRVPAARDAARAALAFARLAAGGEERFRTPALESARFVLNLQYREDNAFAFPHIERYRGGVRADLHHVAANLEETLDALAAWSAARALLGPGEIVRFE